MSSATVSVNGSTTSALLRIEDIGIGCGVSLFVGLLFWPRGAGAALSQALSQAYTESGSIDNIYEEGNTAFSNGSLSQVTGYTDNLLLSADYNFTARSAARPGYGSTLTVFVPKLREAGVKDETIRRITIDNPRRFLAFVPKNG